MQIFSTKRDYAHFLQTLTYYQIDSTKPKFSNFNPLITKLDTSKKLAEIICYCLMPNHFHLLLKQVREDGITTLMRKLSNSYTKYFNTKYMRIGPLFQGRFGASFVANDEQLMHVSRYIHLNPLVGGIIKDLKSYKWSSYNEYLGDSNPHIARPSIILSYFQNSKKRYEQFVNDQVDYAKQLEAIKHILLE